MAKALMIAGYANNSSQATGACTSIPGGTFWAPSGSESGKQNKYRVPGKLSLLGWSVNATGTGRFLKLRKNTANGNLSAAATDSTAGIFDDTTNSDTIAAGDILNFQLTEATTNPTIWTTRIVFEATTGHGTLFSVRSGLQYSGVSTTDYRPVLGAALPSASAGVTETNARTLVRAAGKLTSFHANVVANTRTDTTTMKSRINTADGTCVLTIPTGTTGFVEDTTHEDALASGDFLACSVIQGAGSGSIGPSPTGAAVTNIVGGTSTDTVGGNCNGMARLASATAHFFAFGGEFTTWAGVTTESQAQMTPAFECIFSNARIFFITNTCTAAQTVVFRKNAGNGNQSITVTASTSGWFEDTTNTDKCLGSDKVNFQISGGSSGTGTMGQWAVTSQEIPSLAGFYKCWDNPNALGKVQTVGY